MSELNEIQDPNKIPKIDVNKIFFILLKRWYIIVGAIAISLLVASFKLRYSRALYKASLTFKLEDEKPNQINDFFKFSRGTTGKLENFLKTESEIIRSRTFSEKTIKKLGYYVSYYQKGQIITSQVYPNNLFEVSLLYTDSNISGASFYLTPVNATDFRISTDPDQKESQLFHYNDTVYYLNSLFTIHVKDANALKGSTAKPYQCTINNITKLSERLSSNISIEIIKNTSLLEMSFVSDVPDFATDYVNALADVYIEDVVKNKSQAAQQTIDFIDNQLLDLSNKVKKSENEMSLFKSQNNAVDLNEVGKSEFEKVINLESEKHLLSLRKNTLEQLQKSVQSSQNKPVTFIAFDQEDVQTLGSMISLLNQLILDRISLEQKNTSQSPIVLETDKKIAEVKNVLIKNIQAVVDKTSTHIQYNNKLINEANSRLASLPVKELELINIQREFKVNEKVYTFLLEKKLETLINKSSITSNATVIDYALVPVKPISPDTSNTFTIALLIGLTFGVGFIIISRVLYQKIPDKETIESISTAAVIGMIKKIHEHESDGGEYDVQVYKAPKSVFTESIRGIRTNINFILKGDKHKAICITSTVSGEGKTFCTINLAASLTMLNHKVVIVGCDLRRPKLHLSFKKLTNDIGLTTYLIGKSSIEEIIVPTEYPNLYIIPSGPIPPNPAELLQTEEMSALCEKLKSMFDYVLFDTAPVGLVSDSFPILKTADLNLYIFRSQYSKREFAYIPDRLKADNGISNIYCILNSFDSTSMVYSSIYRSEYGGNYGGGGYYYGGYYGGAYGYYGKRYYSQYYTGYYSHEEIHPRMWWKFWNFKRKKK